MTGPDQIRPSVGTGRVLLEAATAALLFGLLVGLLVPWTERFAFDKDEGFNVMKAFLVGQGHELYSEIWSDQPPAFTYALAWAFAAGGATVETARLLVLGFSGLLVGSIYAFLLMVSGRKAAIAGAACFLCLPHAIALSVSVRIGQPSLAMAMLSLAMLAWWWRSRGPLPLTLSALAMAASVLIKAFTAPMLIVFALGIAAMPTGAEGRRSWRASLAWLAIALTAISVVLAATVGPHLSDQLLAPHVQARFNRPPPADEISLVPGAAWPVLALAVLGVIYAILERSAMQLVAAAWMALGTILMARHHPVFIHHYLLFAVPACLLAGLAIDRAASWAAGLRTGAASARGNARLAAIALAAGVVAAAMLIPATVRTFRGKGIRVDDAAEHAMAALMRQHATGARWIATDRAIFAFRAGVPVPPELVLWTSKRNAVDESLSSVFDRTLVQRRPELVLLYRHSGGAAMGILARDYTELASTAAGRLFRIRDTGVVAP